MSDHSDEVLAELRRLRVEVTALRVAHEQSLSSPHRWMRYFVKDLETNPVTQYRVHLYGVIYWLINFPLVTALFFFAPNVWPARIARSAAGSGRRFGNGRRRLNERWQSLCQ